MSKESYSFARTIDQWVIWDSGEGEPAKVFIGQNTPPRGESARTEANPGKPRRIQANRGESVLLLWFVFCTKHFNLALLVW